MNTRTIKKLGFTAILLAIPAAASFTMGCSATDDGQLLGGSGRGSASSDPDSLAAEGNTWDHQNDANRGDNGLTDPREVKAFEGTIGSPEVVARLHGCTRPTYAALGSMLRTRGVTIAAPGAGGGGGGRNGGGTAAQPTTASGIYAAGGAALGVAAYSGRVPEALFASTSSMAKQFDIYIAAANEIVTNYAQATGCTGSTLLEGNNLSKDAISCLMGKPATDDHVSLATSLIAAAPTPADGQKMAIAAILSAAHTCE